MSVQNFSFLACLEVAEKFVWGLVGHVATVSNLNPSYLEFLWVELSWVELWLCFDKNGLEIFLSLPEIFNKYKRCFFSGTPCMSKQSNKFKVYIIRVCLSYVLSDQTYISKLDFRSKFKQEWNYIWGTIHLKHLFKYFLLIDNFWSIRWKKIIRSEQQANLGEPSK